jgi:hypothetical protein
MLAASQGVRADEVKAPTFTAEPCCSLCPAAHDAKNYTTRYQQNFTTLVQAQGDWLFRTQEDLRTEFDTTPPATNACNSCTMRSRQRRGTGGGLPADPWPGEPQQAQPAEKPRSISTRPWATTRPCSAVSPRWATWCRTCRR